MSEPELEFEIDEFGCIRYHVTNEGALLSKDEKEFIIDYVTRMQVENAKLRKLLTFYLGCLTKGHVNCDSCDFAEDVCEHGRKVIDWARELGIEVDA